MAERAKTHIKKKWVEKEKMGGQWKFFVKKFDWRKKGWG